MKVLGSVTVILLSEALGVRKELGLVTVIRFEGADFTGSFVALAV